jgi:hypothetical protein
MSYNKIVGIVSVDSIDGCVYHRWIMGATFLTTSYLLAMVIVGF